MNDAHVHIGRYYDCYYKSTYAIDFFDEVSVALFAVSSTTTCEEDYTKVISEFKELLSIAPDRVSPVLWITPEMIRSWAVFSMFDQGIEWKCLKIHPQLHPTEWLEGSPLMSLVAAIASVKGLPLLIHTGEMAGCYPRQHEWIIKARPDVTFILAHGRPIDQTIELMKTYANVWCDTAFMPVENIMKLCESGLQERVLWGSDYPILKYYDADVNLKERYIDKLETLKSRIEDKAFENITNHNYFRLFRNEE